MRRWADRIIFVATGFLLVLGFIGAVYDPFILHEGDTYFDSPLCSSISESLTSRCYVKVPVTIIGTHVGTLPNGATETSIDFIWTFQSSAIRTVDIDRPSKSFYELRPGQTVDLKVWNGQAVAFYITSNDVIRSIDNPLSVADIHQVGGMLTLGLGLILLFVRPPAALGTLLRRRVAITEVHLDRRLLFALIALLVLQVLDIITSLKGRTIGLFEGNALATAVIRAFGPTLGLTLLKGIAVLALVLALTRFPLHIARILLWALAAVMAYIVLGNVHLIGTK